MFVHDQLGPIISHELEERGNNRIPDDNILLYINVKMTDINGALEG